IRSQIEVDIRQSDWAEEALVAYLMFETGIRPGSKEENGTINRKTGRRIKTYGACTLQARHVKVLKSGVFLDFIGKKGIHLKVQVTNPALVDELKWRKAERAPTDRLFNTQYWHV